MKNVSNATIDSDIGLAINGKRSHRERDSNPLAKDGDSSKPYQPSYGSGPGGFDKKTSKLGLNE